MYKFQVGAGVYLITKNAKGEYVAHDEMLQVARLSTDELGNHYSLLTGLEDAIDWCREEDVFSNLKDAEKECQERNLQNYKIEE